MLTFNKRACYYTTTPDNLHVVPREWGMKSEDWECVDRCIQRLHSETETSKLINIVLEVLAELVPPDYATLSISHPTKKYQLIIHPPERQTDEMSQRLMGLAARHLSGLFRTRRNNEGWLRESDLMPVAHFLGSTWYQEFLKPCGIRHQIACTLLLTDDMRYYISLYREDKGFTKREQRLLNMIRPHLLASLVNALAHKQARASSTRLQTILDSAPGAFGFFDANRTVVWMQPKAQAWLMEFFPDEVKCNGNLPESINFLLSTSAQEGGTPKRLSRISGREILTVNITMSAIGGWVLRLDRKPSKHRAHFHPLAALSPRENEVLRWMAEGKRNSEIAKIMHLSSRTVEKHVAQILVKLGMENRASAIVHAMEHQTSLLLTRAGV